MEIFLNVIKTLLELIRDLDKVKLVHRDLKPRNILFTSKKQVKVIDFGLAATYDQLDQG